jgi:hypothetical protein
LPLWLFFFKLNINIFVTRFPFTSTVVVFILFPLHGSSSF